MCQRYHGPNGDGWWGLSPSRVTADSGTQPSPGAAAMVMGPCDGATGVAPATVSRWTTETGHSLTHIVQPMHSPVWTGYSIIQRSGAPGPPESSTPARVGRVMSSACTGQTSMQIPQLMQPPLSMVMR